MLALRLNLVGKTCQLKGRFVLELKIPSPSVVGIFWFTGVHPNGHFGTGHCAWILPCCSSQGAWPLAWPSAAAAPGPGSFPAAVGGRAASTPPRASWARFHSVHFCHKMHEKKIERCSCRCEIKCRTSPGLPEVSHQHGPAQPGLSPSGGTMNSPVLLAQPPTNEHPEFYLGNMKNYKGRSEIR